MSEAEVSDAVGDKSASEPPYNLVYMDTCYSMDSGTAPGTWGIGGDDEYYFGWHGVVYDEQEHLDFTEYFFADLEDGNTADHALQEADDLTDYVGEYDYSGDPDMRLNWAFESSREF